MKKPREKTEQRLRGRHLNTEVYKIISETWPIHPSGVCRKLNLETTISNISKIKYHFDVLRKKKMIQTKKIDRALVGWPVEVEKLRVLHDFMKDI